MISARPVAFSGRVHEIFFAFAFGVWVLPELIAARLKRSKDPQRVRDRGSLNLIAVLWALGIAADFLFAFYLPQAEFTAGSAAFAAGIVLMLVGTAFRWYSLAVLGKYFTFDVAIQSQHQLVEVGPYRYVRHPSYTGALITVTGCGLALNNWAGFLVNLSCLSAAYAYRIPIEEAALVAVLGKPYRDYAKRTWRLVPFVL